MIDTQEMVIPYSVGLCTASVCADNSLTIEEITNIFNAIRPTGITSQWAFADDEETFLQGAPNPCPCHDFPDTRKHYLFHC